MSDPDFGPQLGETGHNCGSLKVTLCSFFVVSRVENPKVKATHGTHPVWFYVFRFFFTGQVEKKPAGEHV
jgi:hypothetical protein